MLAPFVFKSLAVLIKKGIPRRIKADQFSRCSQHLFGFPPETGTLYNSVMAEVGNMALAAGSCMLAEKTTYFPSGVKAEGVSAAEFHRQSACSTAFGRHDKYIHVSVTVA